MNMIEQIKNDCETGTAGPWFSLPMQGPRKQTNFAGVFATDNDLRFVSHCNDSMNFHSKTDNETNARRIARVPDMEDALIAAFDALVSSIEMDDDGLIGFVPIEAINKFRAAIGAE